MQKTIISLGENSRLKGKTTTIRLTYEELVKEGGRLIDAGRRSRTEVRGAIVEIDGVKVGFASPGDKPLILEENLVPLIEAGCVVVVCATHTGRSKTVGVVERLAEEKGFKVVWIPKACQQVDHADGNRQKADEIKAAVRKAIAEAQSAEAELVGA